ncbi:hypothetical protein J2T57_001524 [Natronocella acetinitrilica]|uniref:PLD phosphodiesterase domain-containing protein n=1 Tax=Natronocella acetinitrilica TaxID=414046 RepID=A0AAE3KFT2_9GAMM|nr:hypothetical protein [Natronocella acetinitrilica]MCP1674422.1 hypothetical protein [Natronocella acetinitrilica]
MSGGLSLLEAVRRGRYSACLAATYALDFPFYEELLLRRLAAQGVTHHLLFADQARVREALLARPPRLLGTHYTLAPMHLARGAFHPKVVLLLGEEHGLLALGSANLTAAGFGHNLEVSALARFSPEARGEHALFAQAFAAFTTWLSDFGAALPAAISELLDATHTLCPWLAETPTPAPDPSAAFFASSASRAPLWEQVEGALPQRVATVRALAPYFDDALGFLATLAERSASPPVIGIQPDQALINPSALADPRFRLADVSALPALGERARFAHAKAIALDGPDASTHLLVGSANLSRPAWLLAPPQGNAEAVMLLGGEAARAASERLGLGALDTAPTPDALSASAPGTSAADVAGVSMLVLPCSHASGLEIPLPPGSGQACAYYPGQGGQGGQGGGAEQLAPQRRGDALHLAHTVLRRGEVVHVAIDGALRLLVCPLFVDLVREHARSGAAREIRQVLSRLRDEEPALASLFEFLERALAESDDAPTVAALDALPREASATAEPGDVRGPLVAPADVAARERLARSRAHARGESTLSSLLSALIDQAGGSTGGFSPTARDSAAVTEDALANAGDEATEDAPIADAQAPGEQAAEARRRALCARKLATLATRLQTAFADRADRRSPPARRVQQAAVALGTLRLLHRLDAACVGREQLEAITRLALPAVFSEEQRPGPLAKEETPATEGYAQAAALALWALYTLGASLRDKPPLSTDPALAAAAHWENAALLFLGQRLNADPAIALAAGRLLGEGDAPGADWLHQQRAACQGLASGGSLGGYELLRQTSGALWGVCLGIERDGGSVRLASIATPEVSTRRFRAEALEPITPPTDSGDAP